MIATLVRRTVRSGWRLLLLVDEAEELLVVGRNDPAVLARLRRVLSRGPDVRTVITATRLLARVDEEAPMPTSPFLQGFIPPVYLTPLSLEEGRALLARGGFAAEDVELVLQRTACHPFLVQLLASRLFESRDLAATLDQLAADEMVANYFSVDFSTLEETRARAPVRRWRARARSAARALARGARPHPRTRSRRRSTGCRCSATCARDGERLAARQLVLRALAARRTVAERAAGPAC